MNKWIQTLRLSPHFARRSLRVVRLCNPMVSERSESNHRGSIVFAFLLILVLSGLSAAILLKSVNESRVANRMANSSAALWAAEAGVQKVLWEYNYNNCRDMIQQSSGIACTDCTCGSVTKSLAGTLTGYADYDVTFNSANTTLQSVGSVPSRSAANLIQRRVQVTVGRPPTFGNGIFAQGQVWLSNNALIDSYNSSNGPYGGSNILHNGNIGTNGTGSGIINLSNNVTVDGNLSTGPGGTVTKGNNVTVTGTTTSNNSVALPAVVVPSTLTGLSSGGTLSIANNGSQTLNAGNYKYTNISMANNATLNINGNVSIYLTGATDLTASNNVAINVTNGSTLTIYLDGTLSVNNNAAINNVSRLPSNLQIYSTYTGSNGISIGNNATTYAAVYAPTTDVNMSNNDSLYGAVVGKTVTLNNNAAIHYDQVLATVANPFQNAITSNWQEY